MGEGDAESNTGVRYAWKFDHYGICGGKHTLKPKKERRLDSGGLCYACHRDAVKREKNTGGDGI